MGCFPWGTAGLDGGTAVAPVQRIAVNVVARGYDESSMGEEIRSPECQSTKWALP